MKEVIEGILANRRETLEEVKISNPIVEVSGRTPYREDEEFSINIRWVNRTGVSSYFHVSIHALFGCCGVIELNRPTGTFCYQQEFDVVMDAVMEGLRQQTDPKMNSHDLWGNQILATTSTESYRYFCPYLVSRKWQKFRPAKNPRTGNVVTIWKKIL